MAPDVGARRPTPVASLLIYADLARSARRSPDAIRIRQTRAVRATLDQAAYVPLYRDLRACAPHVRTLDELLVIDKTLLQAARAEHRRAGPTPPKTRVVRTSGTTGQPLATEYPPAGAWYQGLLGFRTRRARGLAPWTRSASFGLTPGRPPSFGLSRLKEPVRRSFTGPSVADFADDVLAFRPKVVSGHSHVLVELGEALAGRLAVKALCTFGESVLPEDRATLRRLFGVTPLDTYGTAETGVVAWQCGRGDLYHVNHEAVAAEILDDRGDECAPGQEGDLVLTTLWNPLMPVLRYRVGDRATWSGRQCVCGSRLPAIDNIQGRTFDWLMDADGRRISPQRLWIGLRLAEGEEEAVRRYRVHQDGTGVVDVRVVLRAGRMIDLGRLESSYRSVLGRLPVHVHVVDDLAPDPSGKYRAITNASPPRT